MRFSLIIPVAPERNAEVVDSLKNIDYPKSDFQVIVVRGKNPSENRNKGFEKSTGEIIGFLDDDAKIKEDILKKVDKFFSEHPEIDIVGGPQITPKDERGFAKISGYALSSLFGGFGIRDRYRKGRLNLDADERLITSANLFCKRNVMENVKFDTGLFPGEDPKFIKDSKRKGFKIAYSPDILIYHRRRPTIKTMAKQIFKYGKVKPAKESFFETIKKPFFLIPSIFVLYLISLIVIIILSPRITGAIIGGFMINSIFFLPLIAYIILAVLFSINDSIKNKDLNAVFILPFIYFLIHISYGIGMLVGYYKK